MPTDTATNNKRIAKNTLMLYFRMILMMCISLYTSRVVLQQLGVEDFGIYNIVGGVVVLFSFINGAMTAATQRFLTFELGRGDMHEMKRVFSMSMTAHISIALLVFLLAETVGLWFLNTQLNIPAGRTQAAFWCYQFSILATCFQMLRVPYNACIIAHERMSIYAYVSIVDSILRLIIVYLLMIGNVDRLILYSALMFMVALLINLVYKLICNRLYSVSRYNFFWDAALYKRLMSFSGWSLFGSASTVIVGQGANMLMNIFFGVGVNAAAGIGNQVSHAVYNFVSNFQTAFNPSIVKTYAAGQRQEFFNIISRASKLSFLLMFLISLPVLLNTRFLLQVWLDVVPAHAVAFSQLIILCLILEAIAAPFWMATQAIGQIRNYQIMISTIYATTLPLGYAAFKLGYPVESIFVVRIIIYAVAYVARVIYLRVKVQFPTGRYLIDVPVRCLLVAALTVPLPLYLSQQLTSWTALIVTTAVSVSLGLVVSVAVGLNAHDRRAVINILSQKILRRNK